MNLHDIYCMVTVFGWKRVNFSSTFYFLLTYGSFYLTHIIYKL